MPRTGNNIYKRKDGRWEGRYPKGYKDTGKIAYGYVYAKTYSEVKEKLKINLVAPIHSTANKTNITFSELAKQWLQSASLQVKASTYARYSDGLDIHILPLLGGYKITKISSQDVERFTEEKLETGRIDGNGGLSPKTVRDLLSIIKAVLDYAKTQKYITEAFQLTYPKYRHQEMRVLSKQEQTSLEKILTDDMNSYKLGVLLCLYTGLRLGEVCALRWGDIVFSHQVLSVRKTVQRIKSDDGDIQKTKIVIDSPKSKCSLRQIPLPDFLMDHLARFYKSNAAFVLSGIEERPAELRTLQNHFKQYVSASAIEQVNFHTLRHTFATRCVEAGVDIKSLSEILGHSNVNITLNRYVHSSLDQKRECVNRLAQFMRL